MFEDMQDPPRPWSITREQVKSFVNYDTLLRSGEDRTEHPTPLGYDEFAFIFNYNEPEILVKFTTTTADGSIKVNGPAVTVAFIVGEDEEPVIILAPVQPTVVAPQDPDGGRWLNKRKAELIDATLWDNLERAHHQNARRDKAIKTRRDRRRGPYVPHPHSAPAPQPPSAPAPIIPQPPKNTPGGSTSAAGTSS
ncbi:hypothetical protein EV702DRAFT_1041250 [Suillus placidus]|uniref:Uncharacterized protein n=1 Tax=Suillus placidus TaxID=48579 RepID=A0A9P7D7K5_9AGAM|nr:hypothetical protein EV702DRAFT_1041250 [Suillus placidus]